MDIRGDGGSYLLFQSLLCCPRDPMGAQWGIEVVGAESPFLTCASNTPRIPTKFTPSLPFFSWSPTQAPAR